MISLYDKSEKNKKGMTADAIIPFPAVYFDITSSRRLMVFRSSFFSGKGRTSSRKSEPSIRWSSAVAISLFWIAVMAKASLTRTSLICSSS